MDPASRASQAIEEGLYDRPKSLWSSATEDIEIEPLDTMAGGIKGYVDVFLQLSFLLNIVWEVFFINPGSIQLNYSFINS